MNDWKDVKIGDLCKIKHGFAFKGIYFVDEPQKYVCVTPGNFSLKGGFKNDKPKYYNGPIPEDYILREDDLIVTMTDLSKAGDTLGYSALVPYDKRYTFLHNQRIGLITDLSSSVEKHFLYWIMRTYDYQRYIVSHCSGSTVKHTSPSNIGSYCFKCPTKDIQKKIVDILDNIESKIEFNKRINENLEQQAQALFDNVLMNEELPRDKVLKDYAFINPTRSKKKGEIARYIDMSSLPTKGSFPSDWVNKPYNGGMKFQNGDTLMARITPCLENGKTAYINFLDIDEVAFGSTEYIVMAPHDGISSELFYFLARNKDFVSYAVAHMNGSSGRQRVSATDIESYIMPNIPSDLIKQFGERAEVIMECIKTNSIENRRLAELRDTLLPRLMSGELKVQNTDLINEMLEKGIR